MKTSERAVLVAIVVAVALALRWGFVATAVVRAPLRADAGEYARYAQNLVEHGVYSLATTAPPAPDSFRSPGYPWFLAACRFAAGEGGWMALAIGLQVVLGAMTALLVFRIARSFVGFAPALAACALCALSPHLVVSSAYVLTECLTTAVLATGLWLLAGGLHSTSRLRLGASAAMFGVAVLCNETLLFVPFVAAWPLWRRCGLRSAASFLLVALLPFAGWTLRNQSTALVRTGGERAVASISHGSYPGMVFRDVRYRGFPYREDPEQPAFGASWQNLREVLGRRVAADPLRYASWYLLEKPVWLWGWNLVQGTDVLVYDVGSSPYERQAVMAASHALMRWLHAPLMWLAALGALAAAVDRRRRFGPAAQVLGLCAVFGTLAYVPVIPDPRYLQPFRPILFVLAAAAAAWLVAAVQRWVLRRCSASPAADSIGSSLPSALGTDARSAPPSR